MSNQELSTHRPARPLNRVEFRRWIQTSAFVDVLPSRLDEKLLLGLARELRVATRPDTQEGIDLDASAPVLMVRRLLAERRRLMHSPHAGRRAGSTDLSWALGVLQFALDKEIVTRILGVGGENCDEFLLTALDMPRKRRAVAA